MTNYKDTPEGRAVAQKYGDILHLSRPEPSPKHPRMSLGSRAKIFSPFAALRGFDEELSEESARTRLVQKAGLAEEERAALREKLAGLARGQQVTARYFCADPLCQTDPPLGRYQTVTGAFRGVDWAAGVVRLDLAQSRPGPGLEKAHRLDISLEDLAAVDGTGQAEGHSLPAAIP